MITITSYNVDNLFGIVVWTKVDTVSFSSSDVGLVTVNTTFNFDASLESAYGTSGYKFRGYTGKENEVRDFYFLISKNIIMKNFLTYALKGQKTPINILDKISHYPSTDTTITLSNIQFKLLSSLKYGSLYDIDGNIINTNDMRFIDTYIYIANESSQIEKLEFQLLYQGVVQIEYSIISIAICREGCHNTCDINKIEKEITN